MNNNVAPVPQSPFQIRAAKPEEFAALADVERCAAELFRTVGYDYCAEGPLRSTDEHQFALDHGVNLIAELNGDMVAFALAVPIDGDAHLQEISTHPDYQRRGIARALIENIERWARDNNFRRLTLTTYCTVPWNQPFYERLGFRAFSPDDTRPELLQLIAAERAHGYHFAPRTAMLKTLADD